MIRRTLRRTAKSLFYGAAYLAGKRTHDGGITILSYHSIDDYATPLSVSPALFGAQMQALSGEGCVTYTMSQVAEHILEQRPFPPKAMAITFDDGFESILTEAAPIMRQHSFTATVYIITGMVGRITRWTDRGAPLPQLPLLTWPQIAALHQDGFEIGAHSVTHGFLTTYPPDDLYREMTEPQDVIWRELGILADSFAYPQGDYSRRVEVAAMSAGYTTAVTVNQGRATLNSNPTTLPRLLVSNNTTPATMRAFTTPAIGPAYKLLNFAIKHLLGRKRWPRRAPGDVDSSGSVKRET